MLALPTDYGERGVEMVTVQASLRRALLLSSLAALAACGSKQEEPSEPKSVAEVKQEAAKLDRPRPGQYRQTVQIEKIEVPGMPSEAADRMKGMMQAAQVHEFCLTAEDADKGFRDMFDQVGRDNRECTFTRFDVSGGTLDAQMDCKSAQGGSGVMKLAGKVSETESDITMSMDVKGGNEPMGAMTMTMHMKTERIGDCKS